MQTNGWNRARRWSTTGGQQPNLLGILVPHQLKSVLSFLAPTDIMASSLGSSRWHGVATSDALWRSLCHDAGYAGAALRVPPQGSGGSAASDISWLATFVEHCHSPVLTRVLLPRPPGGLADERVVKLLMVGDSGAGKSAFLLRFADDAFTENPASLARAD